MRQQYTSYVDCVTFFTNAALTNPELFTVDVIGQTHEGRDIIVVAITNGVKEHQKKPALFFTGTIHAREWVGIEIALALGEYILEHASYDPKLNDILNSTTLYMVPCANPDGFEYSRNHFAFWRKNRRLNADGSYGVDLNRNFEVGFSQNNIMSSNVYSGENPFSEPETRALRDFFLLHPNITIALDYHSQGNVFFPAHNFLHEDDESAVDLTRLAANMAEEIRKESGREYGNHMGKPPTKLISGSGREFYFSQGALALVAEVGSRNISDYQENMSEHIDENIPALIFALGEANNYKKEGSLPRVHNFLSQDVQSREVMLTWEYESDEDIYFEIYRSKKYKGYAQSSNRIGSTRRKEFTDRNLEPSTNYYYFIRGAHKKRGIKSAFAQVLSIRTNPASNSFSKILYPTKDRVGYVGEKTLKNRDHFGQNSLFVGCSQAKGESFGVIGFSLQTLPKNAIITSAKISVYPMNRVAVHIEKYGEWRIGQMDERTVDSLYSFDDIKNVKMLSYIDRPTGSAQLSQGVWRTYKFALKEIQVLQNSLKRGEAYFRMNGPDSLPLDRASQMMQWDIGYGDFSGGLTFRPMLDISYTIDSAKVVLESVSEMSISENKTVDNSLHVGFDEEIKEVYGYMEFDLSHLPKTGDTTITEAYIDLEAIKIDAVQNNMRFHLEMVRPCEGEKNYTKMKNKEVIERIGYDVSISDIKEQSSQRFVFDRLAIDELLQEQDTLSNVVFILSASAEDGNTKKQYIDFIDSKRFRRPILNIHYIKKQQVAPAKVKNLKYTLESGIFKLEWEKPIDDNFSGVIVVKNPFRVPCGPYDGQKLYGGNDNYTYDNYGDKDIHKYYAVFSYDNVPNFSDAVFVEVNIS
ncbi:peptidase [Sulfurimonas sp. SAG-AH-194-C21]|nr:M14 family metallopeptidase [Sulfurimonas sp. SAG-AH-194-C21]MDF1882686.1 peptidase [Sulfurimonas sp. SAG-AH-194-C21]